MQILTIIALGLLAGCAALPGEPAGKSGKNAGPVRLGVATNDTLPHDVRCSERQVLLCHRQDSGRRCRCVHTHEARDAVERLARQLRQQGLNQRR